MSTNQPWPWMGAHQVAISAALFVDTPTQGFAMGLGCFSRVWWENSSVNFSFCFLELHSVAAIAVGN
jgi:hypothetical protein